MQCIDRRVISGDPAIGLVTSNYCHALIDLLNTVIIAPHSFSQLSLEFRIFHSGNVLHRSPVWILVHFCSLKPTIPCALVTLQYFLSKICNDPSNENVDKIGGFFASTNMVKLDCDNKSLECLYWPSRTLLNEHCKAQSNTIQTTLSKM